MARADDRQRNPRLGSSPDSFGQTLALLITFLGIGVIANVLIVYVVAQVLAERKQNQERMEAFQRSRASGRSAAGSAIPPLVGGGAAQQTANRF